MSSDDMRKFINIVNNPNSKKTITEGFFDVFLSKDEKEVRAGKKQRDNLVKTFKSEWNTWVGKQNDDRSMKSFFRFLAKQGGFDRDDIEEIMGNDRLSMTDMTKLSGFSTEPLSDEDVDYYIDRAVSYMFSVYVDKETKIDQNRSSYNSANFKKELEKMKFNDKILKKLAAIVYDSEDYTSVKFEHTDALAKIGYALLKSMD